MVAKTTLPAIALALLAGAAGAAQDEAVWKTAYARFTQFMRSKNADERVMAASALGDATFDKHDKQTVTLITTLLGEEVARGQEGKKEEDVSGAVLEACEKALKKVTAKEAVEELVKKAKTKSVHPRVRFHVIHSLAVQKDAVKTLIELVDDKEPLAQLASVDALAQLKDPAAIDTFVKVLCTPERGWESKLAALNGIEKLDDKSDKTIDGLIDSLDKLQADEVRVKVEVIRVLGKFLGIEKPTTADAGWWREAKKNKDAPVQEGHTMSEPAKFFGLETKSSRIIYVLDITGSMEDPLTIAGSDSNTPPEEPKAMPTGGGGGKKADPADEAAHAKAAELRKKIYGKKVVTRMDVLKRELVESIYGLDKNAQFAVVWYEMMAKPWKEQMLPATWANKAACLEDIDKKSPGGGTNIWGGLEAAFKFVEAKPNVVVYDKDAKYATAVKGADTIFLMTDGGHNNGKFAGPQGPDVPAFIGELKKVNALRKIIINTIALGNSGGQFPMTPADAAFMERIATETGGKYVRIGK